MIGVDPHKGSHTAVAIGAAEEPLGELRVRACPAQAGGLVTWAAGWPERIWAVEGAAGLGHLLAKQLVAVGERVLDVPPKLAARVRLLEAGDTNKNDPNDALSVAVAALRSRARREVTAEDHAAVLWPRSPRSATRTATAAPSTTRRSPRARRTKRPSGHSSSGSATPSSPACGPTPARLPPRHVRRAREGNRGTTLTPARPAHTPTTGSSHHPHPNPPPP